MPSQSPSNEPSAMPSQSQSPSKEPSMMPSTSPTPSMESMVVTGVGSAWTTVSLSETYVSPIAVCTVKYDTGTLLVPAVVRMQNVGPTSFEIRLQRPISEDLSLSRDVHCVVVEEGSWKMPDGRKIEANKYVSTVTDYAWSYWVGQRQIYANSYTDPIVLG